MVVDWAKRAAADGADVGFWVHLDCLCDAELLGNSDIDLASVCRAALLGRIEVETENEVWVSSQTFHPGIIVSRCEWDRSRTGG